MKYTFNWLSNEISTGSLFYKGGTYTVDKIKNILKKDKFKYCKGKYNDNIIKDIPKMMIKDNCIIWYERRKDQYGKYIQLYTIHDEALNKKLFNIIKNTI